MQISDDNLIAYLLGDASRELSREIERQLALDRSVLLDRLNHFRMVLGQIDSVSGIYEPPGDLVDTTLARIDAVGAEHRTEPDGHPIDRHLASGLSPTTSTSAGQRVWDSAVLTLCLSLLCCLVLPAIVSARFGSRRAQCADSLRVTGVGLMHFALSDPQRRFPYVSSGDRNSFAGVYAVHLRSSGIPISPAQLQCPSLNGFQTMGPVVALDSIPTFADLEQVAESEVVLLQRAIGGSFAYSLGVVENRVVVAPRYEGRSCFAILADAPVFIGNEEEFVAHDGRGINILYECGRVAFVVTPNIVPTDAAVDYPFRNDLGVHDVGLTTHDQFLAPSHFSRLGGK